MKKALLKIFAIALSSVIGGGLFFLYTMNNDSFFRLYHYVKTDINGSTKGEITSAKLVRYKRAKRDHIQHEIYYTYTVNERLYSSNWVSFKKNDFHTAHTAVDRYPRGKEVIVWFDKDAPEIGLLEKTGPDPDLFFDILMIVSISCFGFFINPILWIAFKKN